MQFSNKTVIVTGGAKGIGKAVADKFLDDGATVIILDKDEPPAHTERETLGFHYYKCDVSKYEELFKVFFNIENTFKTIDVLISNANQGLKYKVDKGCGNFTKNMYKQSFCRAYFTSSLNVSFYN